MAEQVDTESDVNPTADRPEDYLKQARQALAAGNLEQTHACLREALVLAPDNIQLVLTYGEFLQHVGEVEAARRQFVKATVLAPDDPSAQLRLGEALLQLGRLSESRAVLLQQLDRTPGDPNLLALLGDLSAADQDPASARELYTAALQLRPGHPAAIGGLSRLGPDCQPLAQQLSQMAGGAALEPAPSALGGQVMRSLAPATDAWLLLALLVHALRPKIAVRFVPLWCDYIGSLASFTDIYLAHQQAQPPAEPAFDVFYPAYYLKPAVCNQQLLTMWSRTVCVLPVPEAAVAQLRQWPQGDQYFAPAEPSAYTRDTAGMCAAAKPPLTFTVLEERRGQEDLRHLGIPPGAPFVCVHARDQSYDASQQRYAQSFTHYRDSAVGNLCLAMEALAQRGYYILRMGAKVEEPLAASNPMVIDYATSPLRSDFLDIYLLAHCQFYLGGDAGLYAAADIFRRPYAMVNFCVLAQAHTWNPCPFIPKQFWSTTEARPLTLREIFEQGIAQFNHDEQFRQAQVTLVENTPEEIRALAIEVEERGRGVWQASEADEALQQRWWTIFKCYAPPEWHGVYRARVGAEYLRQNQYLLAD